MSTRIVHDKYCTLKCINTGRQTDAEVYNFKFEESLGVLIRTRPPISLILCYDKKQKLYVGTKSGLSFTTRGPKCYQIADNIRQV